MEEFSVRIFQSEIVSIYFPKYIVDEQIKRVVRNTSSNCNWKMLYTNSERIK